MTARDPRTLADELVESGRLLEAIEALTIANRARRDPGIEVRLVELRLAAVAHLGPSSGPRRWPPKTKDRFRGAANPPEITPGELTPDALRSGIFRHGCILVRGLASQPRVEGLIDNIEHAIAAHDAHAQGTPLAEVTPWFVPFDPGPGHIIPRQWGRAGGGVLAVDSPPVLFDVIEAFEEIGIGDLVNGFLGEPPVMLAQKWTLRRAREEESYPVWHQDGAFMGRDIRSVDIWLSLSHCGVDAPGLDLVSRRLDQIVAVGTEDARFDWCVADSVAEEVARGEVASPVFAPGDALMFDHMLLHRTALRPEMTRDRYAIEAWFASPSNYPDDQIAIAY
ncbi:MAG: hypothetical protein WD598_17895 [Acidimicrobiia bacterium]